MSRCQPVPTNWWYRPKSMTSFTILFLRYHRIATSALLNLYSSDILRHCMFKNVQLAASLFFMRPVRPPASPVRPLPSPLHKLVLNASLSFDKQTCQACFDLQACRLVHGRQGRPMPDPSPWGYVIYRPFYARAKFQNILGTEAAMFTESEHVVPWRLAKERRTKTT